MTSEGAGRRAWETRRLNDAHVVRDLYRAVYASPAKAIARRRAIETLVAAGGTVCVDLWGGGTSAHELINAGFRVIAVENGSQKLIDSSGVEVSADRKRRAFETTAREDGYEARWGSTALASAGQEADCALLDFCGPWTRQTRLAVTACKGMRAVIVTLTTGHDAYSGAETQRERMAAYIVWLKMAYRPTTQRQLGLGGSLQRTRGRLLTYYRSPSRALVWMFLLSAGPVPVRRFTNSERVTINPDYRKRTAVQAANYQRNRRATDPEYKRRYMERVKAWTLRQLEKDPDYLNRQQRNHRAKARSGDPTYRPRGRRPSQAGARGVP